MIIITIFRIALEITLVILLATVLMLNRKSKQMLKSTKVVDLGYRNRRIFSKKYGLGTIVANQFNNCVLVKYLTQDFIKEHSVEEIEKLHFYDYFTFKSENDESNK
jgi:hypothetical protein